MQTPLQITFLILLLITKSLAIAEQATDPNAPTLILFDRSGSMKKEIDGRPRMELAKEILESWSKKLTGRKNVAFRFFAGGKNTGGNAKKENCTTTELIISFGQKVDASSINDLVNGLKPTGLSTNIAFALKQAKKDFAGQGKGRIVLISDGLENCQEDPVLQAKELKKLNITIDVLGIGTAEDVGSLGKIALVSGGQFTMANSASSLKQQLGNTLPNFDLPEMPAGSDTASNAAGTSLVTIIDAGQGVPAIAAPAIEALELKTTKVAESKPRPVAIELILDASGSMKGEIQGESKISIARKALKATLKSLQDPVFLVGLRAYGFDHNVPKTKAGSCPNTELLTKIIGNNIREITSTAYKLKPYGYTPISQSLLLAGQDLEKIDAANRMIILITDGKETCDGDPEATAKKLCEMGVGLETHIVGFDLETKTAEEMRKVAKAGCGSYVDAKNAQELTDGLIHLVTTAKNKIDPTWLRTIHPVEGGNTPETAVEITSGTYTLTRALKKGEIMYFRAASKIAQHVLLRGLIQSKRLIRLNNQLVESKSGTASFTLKFYPPDDKRKRGRGIRLAGEVGTFKSVGYSDTSGDGIVFSIGDEYDTVHADSLFNLEFREAGDVLEGHEAADKISDKAVRIPLDQTVIGHLGEGDFIDVMQLPKGARKGKIIMNSPNVKYRVYLLSATGKKIFRSQTSSGKLAFDIPAHNELLWLKIEDRTPRLAQVFTAYELSVSSK